MVDQPDKTSPAMDFAAKELQKYIAPITDLQPEIVVGNHKVAGQKILISSATSVR